MTMTMLGKELVAVAVSVAAGCRPCTTHHVGEARRAGATEAAIEKAVGSAVRVRTQATDVNRRRKVTPDRRPKLTPPPCEARTVALAPAELVGVAQPGRARFGEVQATLVGQARFLKRRALVPSGRCAVNLGRSRGAERWPGVQ